MPSRTDVNAKPSESLRRLMLEAIRSPRRAGITIAPTADGLGTEVRLKCDDGGVRRWSLRTSPQYVSERDVRPIRRFLAQPAGRLSGRLMLIPQLLGWGVGLTGLFAASTICPCCGQVGCVLGVGTMGIMGGLTASLVALVRRRRKVEEPRSC
jgi:hypothetical protein